MYVQHLCKTFKYILGLFSIGIWHNIYRLSIKEYFKYHMLCNLFTISLFSRSILVVYFTFSLTTRVFTFRDNFQVSLIHIKAWITPKIHTFYYNNFWATYHFYFLFFNNVLFYDKVFLNIRTRTVKHKTWCETSRERKWCSIRGRNVPLWKPVA